MIVTCGTALMIGTETGADKAATGPLLSNKDQLNYLLSKIHSLRAANSTPRSSVPGGFDLNVSLVTEQPSFEPLTKVNGNPSTMDLLAVLSAASSPGALSALSQAKSNIISEDKTKVTCAEPAAHVNPRNQLRSICSDELARNICTPQTQFEVSKYPVEKAQPSLLLQLFSSEDERLPKMGSTGNHVSSDSSNPMDDGSLSCSPPFAQKLFPLNSVAENMKNKKMSVDQDDVPVERGTSHGIFSRLDLFKESERRAGNGMVESVSCHAGYSSSSGSDHSPSSSNSDGQVKQ